ncbi:hypothetical protein NL676_029060 [Syzygium grande]|nr:hypothetical protein NL676_029060 [Syzygium grande]
MRRLNKNANDPDEPSKQSDPDAPPTLPIDPDKRPGYGPMRVMGVFVVCLMATSVVFSLSVVLRDPPTNGVPAEGRRVHEVTAPEDEVASQTVEEQKNELLGGLLAAGFDEGSCLSRYQSVLFRKESKQKPSSYLISRLRGYEALHKRCGPHSESYKRTLEMLKSGHSTGISDCNYVIWISFSGLGNRILTLASAFLYAILTNRVLLIDPGVDMTDLFCEPFPEVSWFLPSDFPLRDQFNGLNQNSPHCYGKMLTSNTLSKLEIPSFMYLHLVHDYNDHDKLFFCDEDQSFLQSIPWLIMRTDNYFVPSLFLIPSFERELDNLFPERENVFHFLGRYLFHPTNSVWGLIRRYYQTYLAKADERIGIQIRVFDTGVGPFQHVLDQILACTARENLLPRTIEEGSPEVTSLNRKSKAVLVTSLSSGYFERIRDIYWHYPTTTGEAVSIVQPSHEEYQQTEKEMHNRKAWAEMYLLSMTDVLITSSWSTFGYVAQGLGEQCPWSLVFTRLHFMIAKPDEVDTDVPGEWQHYHVVLVLQTGSDRI